jgi:hypothetical protein
MTVTAPARTVIAFVRCGERPRLPRCGRPYILLVCIGDPDLVGGGEPALAASDTRTVRVIEVQEYIRHIHGYTSDAPR